MTSVAQPDRESARGADLDPAIRRFVRAMSQGWAAHPGLATVSPAEARLIADVVRAPWAAGGPSMRRITEHHVPTPHGPVRVRCYDPGGEAPRSALIYLHGGGWTLFSLDTHDRVMREIAARASLMVVGVDYALSPEAKYPVALDQVVAFVEWIGERGSELGIDPGRLAIGGDSAGANLAVATCLRLRDLGGCPLPRAMVLNYGVFDRVSSPEAHRRFGGEGYMLSTEDMELFWNNYLRDERDLQDPLVCPILADLRGLPASLLIVPECDLLAEQSLRMADLLRAVEVSVVLEVFEGASHSFLEAVSASGLARRALVDIAVWLSSSLTVSSA
jgi:acetyl esterase